MMLPQQQQQQHLAAPQSLPQHPQVLLQMDQNQQQQQIYGYPQSSPPLDGNTGPLQVDEINRRVPPLQRRKQQQQQLQQQPALEIGPSPAISTSSAQPSQLTTGLVTHASTQKEALMLLSSASGNHQQPNQHQSQQHMPARQLVVHEAFSISQLERKFMFLNEPNLQMRPNNASDQIKQLWRVHHTQMLNMRKPSEEEIANSLDLARPHSYDEAGGQAGFSSLNKRPKDFDIFQQSVRNQLAELNQAHKQLRTRFKEAGQEVERDISRIENLTGHIQTCFNDFVLCFNSFVQREERLETLHHQAIKKSQELSKKIQLEVMAQSSQRSQLLAIVDDLTEQLKQTKASTVKTQELDKEEKAHKETKALLQVKQKQIAELESEVKAMNSGLQQLGQQAVQHQTDSQQKYQQIRRLESIIESQSSEIEDLLIRRGQLEQEVSRLKSQVELTQSSKDKIILKLKQEMRLQAQQTSVMNGTLTNASAYAIQQANASNYNVTGGSNMVGLLNASPQQHHPQIQIQQQQQQQQLQAPMPSAFRQQ